MLVRMRLGGPGDRPNDQFSWVIVGAVLLVAVLVGCNGDIASSASPHVRPTPTANPWLDADRLSRAVAFRQKSGLRADEAWVRQVAANPDAQDGVIAYGVPLTPDELRAFEARITDVEAVRTVVDEYGKAHAADWAGSTQDIATGIVTARFAAPIAPYEAALWARVPPNARLSVVQVNWSLQSLEAIELKLRDDMVAGSPWFAENGMVVIGGGIDVRQNQLAIQVSSRRTDVDDLLEARYGAMGMLAVAADGTGVLLLPKGNLVGRVIDQAGAPVVGASIELEGSIPGAGPGGDVGYQTSSTGRFRVDEIPAITYALRVYTSGELNTRVLLAMQNVTVVRGETTNVTVVVK
jgi:hypothetical protein